MKQEEKMAKLESERIANVVRAIQNPTQRYVAAGLFANELRRVDPRFDVKTFILKCGIYYEQRDWRTQIADAYAATVLPIILKMQATGASVDQIAAELNARKIATARNRKWYGKSVSNILTRRAVIEGLKK
jgi:hypothetical protein